MKKTCLISMVALIGGISVASAGDFEQPVTLAPSNEYVDPGGWEFAFRPYLWMTGLEGTMGVNGISAPMDIDFGDIIDDLDFAWSSTFEARRGKWGVMLDFTYLKLSDSFVPTFAPPVPIAPAGFEMEMYLVDLVGSYRAWEWDSGFFEFTGGVRWMSLENTIALATVAGGATEVGGQDNWFDPHIGFRVNQELGERFYLRAFADIGGFDVGSDVTAQALVGIGYQLSECVSVELAYRYLKEDYDDSPALSFDAEMSGPLLGMSITF